MRIEMTKRILTTEEKPGVRTAVLVPVAREVEEGAEDLVNGSAAGMEEVFSEMTADSWEAGAADSFSSTL